MRVVVFGGRTWGWLVPKRGDPPFTPELLAERQRQRQIQFSVMSSLHVKHVISTVIEGEATGADKVSRIWAEANGVPVDKFPADWLLHKKRAGPIRNAQMIKEGLPELGLGFPGGNGTRDMTKQLIAAGISTWCITVEGKWLEAERAIAASA